MKEWKKPEIDELNVNETASGGDEDTIEHNGGFLNGSWKNACYDAVNTEKCEGQGSVMPKKSSTPSA